MNLIIDIGNSRTKAALFREGDMAEKYVIDNDDPLRVQRVQDVCVGVDSVIVSSTREPEKDLALVDMLRERCKYLLMFDNTVPVPLKSNYSTPQTLGRDRIAAAVGGWTMFPDRNLLIVDFGTAITADVVSLDGTYLGGSISPGAWLRALSLNKFTGRLPLVDPECCAAYDSERVPVSTKEAIMSGVAEGIVFEIKGRMEEYARKFDSIVTIFTGGEACFFEKRFKNTIFANYDLVLAGLNTILNYNAQKKEIS